MTTDRRRAVFRALVEAQDAGAGVGESRADVARQFGLTEAHVRAIEDEGLGRGWPPL
jgi:hypothetical protein